MDLNRYRELGSAIVNCLLPRVAGAIWDETETRKAMAVAMYTVSDEEGVTRKLADARNTRTDRYYG